MVNRMVMNYITKVMYLVGFMMLLIGLLLTVLNIPVSAASGAIWTTKEGCDNPAPQDENEYAVGETVHIRGSNFDPNTPVTWTIAGQPGSATPGVIAYDDVGIHSTNEAGYFCIAAHIVQPGEDGVYTVDVKVGNSKKNDNYHVNGIEELPLLVLDKSASPSTYSAVGEVISYSYLLTNGGNVPLEAPYSVTDDKAAAVCPQSPDPLPVGDSITCTGSYAITQADLDAGSVTNVATGFAYCCGDLVTSNIDSETVTALQDEGLTLVKTANPSVYDAVGQVISYSYLLTNSGNVTLQAPFTVTDDKTTVTCPATPISLAPGESITCTATYTITQADLDGGSVTNTATGYGYFNGGQVPSNEDDETVTADQIPDLLLVKTADDAFFTQVGQVLTYTYDLTNSGNVSLSPTFNVIDNKTASMDCEQPEVLLPGESVICTASYQVTQADLDAGQVVNLADGQGYYIDTLIWSNQDSAVVPAQVDGPALGLVKTVDPTTYTAVGELLAYSYELTNIGDVTLTGFTVSDDTVTVDCSGALTTLAPGENTTCEASYTIEQADLDAGFVTNLAIGHGFDPGQNPVDSNQDTATATAESNAALQLVKTVDPVTYALLDDVLSYSYLLTNSGEVTLYAPFTVDDDKATVTCPPTPTELAPGESITCTASYTIEQADLDAGSVTNTAMGHGLDPAGAPVDSNEDSETARSLQFTWAFEVEDTPSCAVYPGTECVTFLVTLANIPEGAQVVLDTGLSGLEVYIFSQDGEYQVEVCAPWPGIGFGLVDVEVNIQGILSLHGDGDPQLLDDITARVYYDAETMREQCAPPPQELILLDPYCTEISGGDWGMTWAVENLSDFEIVFVWQITGENPVGDIAPAASQYVLDTVPLGNYTVSIFWGDGQVDSLSAELQLSDCEAPPPPTPTPTQTSPPTGPTNTPPPVPTTPPGVTATPDPTAPAPVTEGEVLIPVTGLDMNAFLTLFGPFRKALLFTGLAFIGMAFIFQGVRSRFKK